MCYKVLKTELTWEDALKECANTDSNLASISSQQDQDFITSLIKENYGLVYEQYWGMWIGLNDITSEKSFVWSDGSPVAYFNWNAGEPNDDKDDEDCGMVWPKMGFQWNDSSCGNRKPAICKKRGVALDCDKPKVPKECLDYKTLDDKTRSTTYGLKTYSDIRAASYYTSIRSPDWQGDNWYRFKEPAGTQLPSYYPGYGKCGTRYTAWSPTALPTKLYEETDIKLYFGPFSWQKYWESKVINCDGYYVYYLRNAYYMNSRYCGF